MKYRGINYEVYPSEYNTGRTILLLHGLTGNIQRWDSYIPHLVENATVIACDLIGHGDSDFPDDLREYSAEKHTERILHVLARERIKPDLFVAHSYSSILAAELASKLDFNKSKFLIISPFLLSQSRNASLKMLALESIIPFWKFLKHQRRKSAFMYPESARRTTFRKNKESIEVIGLKSYLAHLNASMEFNPDRYIGKLKNPVTILCKEKDGLYTGSAEKKFRAIIPNIQKKTLPGRGHLFLRENRNEILQEMRTSLLL